MRERRRTLIAAALLLVAATGFDRATPLVSIDTGLPTQVPTTAKAAVDLGVLGTVVLSWTLNNLN